MTPHTEWKEEGAGAGGGGYSKFQTGGRRFHSLKCFDNRKASPIDSPAKAESSASTINASTVEWKSKA